jgi:hypothetical protein
MSKIDLAHVRIQGANCAIFGADATSRERSGRSRLLAQLEGRAAAAGLRVDKAALAYVEGGRTTFFGTPDLVRYLSSAGLPGWTHTIDV